MAPPTFLIPESSSLALISIPDLDVLCRGMLKISNHQAESCLLPVRLPSCTAPPPPNPPLIIPPGCISRLVPRSITQLTSDSRLSGRAAAAAPIVPPTAVSVGGD